MTFGQREFRDFMSTISLHNMSGGGPAGSTAPREPSTASWSVGATATDSPGRYSLNESNRGMNVTRGDSLAYSDDSQDPKMHMIKGTKAHQSSAPQQLVKKTDNVPVFKQPRPEHKVSNRSLNDSQMTEESIRDRSKSACCVVQ